MNEFRKQFEGLQGRFDDRSGAKSADQNRYWPPIIMTGEQIEREVERLASLPLPGNGRRESLIVHPYAESNSPGMTPGIQVKLSVLAASVKTTTFRHNATEVIFCIRGSGRSVV